MVITPGIHLQCSQPEQGCFSFCLLVFVSECFLIFYHAKEFLYDQLSGQQPAATDNTYTGCGPINTNKYTACHVPGDTRRGRDKRGIYSSEGGELRIGGLAWPAPAHKCSVPRKGADRSAASPAGSCHNHSVILHNYFLQISLLALLISHYSHYWLKINNYIYITFMKQDKWIRLVLKKLFCDDKLQKDFILKYLCMHFTLPHVFSSICRTQKPNSNCVLSFISNWSLLKFATQLGFYEALPPLLCAPLLGSLRKSKCC